MIVICSVQIYSSESSKMISVRFPDSGSFSHCGVIKGQFKLDSGSYNGVILNVDGDYIQSDHGEFKCRLTIPGKVSYNGVTIIIEKLKKISLFDRLFSAFKKKGRR